MKYESKYYIRQYEDACNALIDFFAETYDVSVSKEDWVAGVIGSTICINEEYFVNMEDVVLMLRKEIAWDTFLEWWDYNMDASFLGLNLINLRSWVMGAPRLSKEQINGLKGRRKELEDLVEKYKEQF